MEIIKEIISLVSWIVWIYNFLNQLTLSLILQRVINIFLYINSQNN